MADETTEPTTAPADADTAPVEQLTTSEAEVLPTYLPDPTDFPGEGFTALHYGGTESMRRAGAVFTPDSIVIVPESVGRALAGRENLRLVQESPESWPHFLAIRARARANRPSQPTT